MAPYKTSLQEDLRKHICQFRNSHLEKPKIFTVKHFLDEGASKATIYRALERVDNNLGYQSKKGSGPKAKKMDKKHIDQLKKAFDHHHGVSQCQVARRFDCDQSYIFKILKNKTNIIYYKKKKIPHRSESQLARIKPLCLLILSWMTNHISHMQIQHWLATMASILATCHLQLATSNSKERRSTRKRC